MVTTNANDSRPRQDRNREFSNKTVTNQKKYGNREDKPYSKDNNRSYNKDGRSYNRDGKSFNKENGSYNKDGKSYSRDGKSFNKDGRSGYQPNKPYGQGERNNNQSGRNNQTGYRNNFKNRDGKFNAYSKDEDNEGSRFGKGYSNGKDQRMVKASPSKEKVSEQPDKYQAIKRIEKEKKAMQKKSLESKKEKSSRPQMKKKRQNNIDWTRGYENGLYGEDDEDYTLYL